MAPGDSGLKERVRGESEAALARGEFGIVDGEPFSGVDRWLATGG